MGARRYNVGAFTVAEIASELERSVHIYIK